MTRTDLQPDLQLTTAPPLHRSLLRATQHFMETELPRFTAELREMCDIDSPSDDPIALKKMAGYLAARLERAGLKAQLISHARGDAVIAELTGNSPQAPTVLLLGHHDTIYMSGAAEPPSIIRGNHFFGPGSADMKGGLLQGIFALEALQLHTRAFGKIVFLSVPDEEIDDRWQEVLLKDISIAHQPFVLVLESARSIGNVVLKRKGVQRLMLVAKGVPAHAGADIHSGRNAVLELAHQIVQFSTISDLPEGMTVNAGPKYGGSQPNIVPDYAQVIFDVRFLAWEHLEWLLARWHELMRQQLVPGVELSLTALSGGIPPMTATEASKAAARHLATLAQLLGHEYVPETRGGSSDGGNVSSFGFSVLDGLGAVGHQGHSPDEFIDLAAVPEKTALLTGLIAHLAAAR